MRGNNKTSVEKTKQQQNDEAINKKDLITEQWEDEQIDIFTDIILAVLIKESQKNIEDEECNI